MYCKWWTVTGWLYVYSFVLIVAKCIVNVKIYKVMNIENIVLIVAKCIVNKTQKPFNIDPHTVLIVAKCIVNFNHL